MIMVLHKHVLYKIILLTMFNQFKDDNSYVTGKIIVIIVLYKAFTAIAFHFQSFFVQFYNINHKYKSSIQWFIRKFYVPRFQRKICTLTFAFIHNT